MYDVWSGTLQEVCLHLEGRTTQSSFGILDPANRSQLCGFRSFASVPA
jgi:hypothetical protein